MQVFESVAELRKQRHVWRLAQETVAMVPTMGNLHDGHLELVKQAKAAAKRVVVSIFVNPMQFGANEDLATYPRTIEEDKAKLMAHGVDALLLPSVAEVYPRGIDQQTIVEVPGISDILCGASRPGHFRGVATVVCKLFNMVTPELAFFGQKDYQQLQVIRLMASDLCIDIDIRGIATQRAADGLALSSRNGYLNQDQRTQAAAIYQQLTSIKHAIENGERDFNTLQQNAISALESAGFRNDYLAIKDATDLSPVSEKSQAVVILIAMFLGSTRLIDNITAKL